MVGGSPVVLLNGGNVLLESLHLLCTQFCKPALEGGRAHGWDGAAGMAARSLHEAAATGVDSRDARGVLLEYAQTPVMFLQINQGILTAELEEMAAHHSRYW